MSETKMTREQAARRIVEIREDRAYWEPWRNRDKNALLIQEMLELQAIAMQPVEVPEEERKARGESEKAKQELTTIRADPAFWDRTRYPDKNAQLVARANELAPVAYRFDVAGEGEE